ncbi:MAG: Hpt domain-containing protein [Cellvibrio sp.]|uniref:Hpt domain-containing protein n=1 Tax=Cellvibrio sp. TaxID=1965322 RepID=UPI00319F611A
MEHLDYETLTTLKDVMEDDFALLIDTFVQDSTERVRTLHTVIESLDADAIRRAAHSFKGSSSNIGALQLSALCSALEKKALANNFDGLVADLSAIEREFAQVQNLLRSL